MKKIVRLFSAMLIAFLFCTENVTLAFSDFVPTRPSLTVIQNDGVINDVVFTFTNPENIMKKRNDVQFEILCSTNYGEPVLFIKGDLKDTLVEDSNSKVYTSQLNPSSLKNFDILKFHYGFQIRYLLGNEVLGSSNFLEFGRKQLFHSSPWSQNELNAAQQNHLIPDSFNLNLTENITREEFTEILIKVYEKIQGVHLIVEENFFLDSKNPSVSKASNLGLVYGTGNGYFNPNKYITRQEMATIISRLVQVLSHKENVPISLEKYRDDNQISPWAQEPVYSLKGASIMEGNSENEFMPLENASREQGVIIGLRAYYLLKE